MQKGKGYLKMVRIKVGIIHLADVRNYGDVLFPLLMGQEFRHRLPNAEISYISATGSMIKSI
jgi:hypothetical protein